MAILRASDQQGCQRIRVITIWTPGRAQQVLAAASSDEPRYTCTCSVICWRNVFVLHVNLQVCILLLTSPSTALTIANLCHCGCDKSSLHSNASYLRCAISILLEYVTTTVLNQCISPSSSFTSFVPFPVFVPFCCSSATMQGGTLLLMPSQSFQFVLDQFFDQHCCVDLTPSLGKSNDDVGLLYRRNASVCVRFLRHLCPTCTTSPCSPF